MGSYLILEETLTYGIHSAVLSGIDCYLAEVEPVKSGFGGEHTESNQRLM